MGIKDEFDIYKPLLKWEDVNEILLTHDLLPWVKVEELRGRCEEEGGIPIIEVFNYLGVYLR